MKHCPALTEEDNKRMDRIFGKRNPDFCIITLAQKLKAEEEVRKFIKEKK